MTNINLNYSSALLNTNRYNPDGVSVNTVSQICSFSKNDINKLLSRKSKIECRNTNINNNINSKKIK